jgi:hypothetical protein
LDEKAVFLLTNSADMLAISRTKLLRYLYRANITNLSKLHIRYFAPAPQNDKGTDARINGPTAISAVPGGLIFVDNGNQRKIKKIE